MVTITRPLMAFLIALLLIIQSANAQTDNYIIVYRSHAQKQARIERPKFTIRRSFNIIPGIAARLDANQVKDVRNDPNVEYVEPDYKIYALGSAGTTATSSSAITALSSSQVIPYGVSMVNAPLVWSRTQGAGVRVAILDTGISQYHPDRGNVVASISYATNSTTGLLEPVEDFDGHGTHTSGTIAAAGNGTGVVGVAPQAELLIAKILDNTGEGDTSWIISGIEWAISNNAKVISMSLGSTSYSASFNTACQNAFNAGALLVAAAGNDSSDNPSYPAAFSSVIAVSAIDQNKNFASTFSNYGSDIALAAPGVGVESTVPASIDPCATADAVWSGNDHQANPMVGTNTGSVDGTICNCGLGTGSGSDVCPPAVAGNIALIERGTTYFAQKVAYAQSMGAVGAIIYNNVAGNFNGSLDEDGINITPQFNGTPLIVVSISQADGAALQTLAQSGITGTVSASAQLYASYDGTSMACPHVAGVAALVFAGADPNITPSEVRAILENSAQDLGAPGWDQYYGYGLVDANAALSLIVPQTPTAFTISGSAGEGGVTMSGLPGNPVTSDSGLYSVEVPIDWSGIVTPTKVGYTFMPPSMSYSNVTAGQFEQNYTADVNRHGLPITIKQLTAKAGKTRAASGDSFTITGTEGILQDDILGSTAIYVQLGDTNHVVFQGVIPYNSAKFKNARYSYTKNRYDPNNVCSGTFDLKKNTFRITAKGLDLTGLSCPVNMELEWGAYTGAGQAAEAVVNGKQPIPMQFLSGYADALRVDKASVHTSTKTNGDSLTVQGAIAFASGMEDLMQHQLTLYWGAQDFNVPAGSFKALTNGRFTWTRPRGDTNPLKRASFDLQKCTFTISVANTTIASQTGTVSCGITCDAFDQTSTYTLP